MKPRNSKPGQRPTRSASDARPTSTWWPTLLRAVGLGAGSLLCVMILLGASGSDENAADNRKKIEAMTPAERAQLKRNYEKYQKLSDEEKRRYREIHQAINSKPELDRVMRSYCNWVKTLSPWEQEDLRNASAEERIELIRKFRTAHEGSSRRRSSRHYREISKLLGFDVWEPRLRFMWIPNPSPELFQEVLAAVEKSLPEPVTYPRPKDKLSDLERTEAILQAALKTRREQEDVDRADWPRPEVVDQIHQILEQNQYDFRWPGDKRGNRPDAGRADLRRVQIPIFLAKGLMDQLYTSVKLELDAINPPDEELHRVFESLDPKLKDYLMKLPPEEMQEKLKYLYLSQNLPPETRKKIKTESEDVKKLIFQQLLQGVEMRRFSPDNSDPRNMRDRMKDRVKERLNEKGERPNNGFRGPGNRRPGARPGRDRRPEDGPPRRPGPPPEKPEA